MLASSPEYTTESDVTVYLILKLNFFYTSMLLVKIQKRLIFYWQQYLFVSMGYIVMFQYVNTM